MSCIIPPKYVLQVLKRLESHGYSAYMVGGCVRDILLERRPNDWDVCTSALPNDIADIFSKTRATGLKHGTVTVFEKGSAVEVTTFRAEGDYTDHRHPENVRFITDLRRDLERRDFTINAIALPLSGVLFDPFDGRADLEKKLIRCVGNPDKRFQEDALRLLRAYRFSAMLGFDIAQDTLAAIHKNAPLAKTLARERVCAELEKTLLSQTPERIEDMLEAGLLDGCAVFAAQPELVPIKALPRNRALRWAALCALLQKAGAIEDAETFLLSLRQDAALVHNCSAACALACPGVGFDRLSLKKLLSRNGAEIGKCSAAACQVLTGRDYLRLLAGVLSSGECWSLKRLAVNGDDLLTLGFRGEKLGKALYALLDHVLEHPDDNLPDILLALAEKLREPACAGH